MTSSGIVFPLQRVYADFAFCFHNISCSGTKADVRRASGGIREEFARQVGATWTPKNVDTRFYSHLYMHL